MTVSDLHLLALFFFVKKMSGKQVEIKVDVFSVSFS